MARGAFTFKQADVKRAVMAVRAAGEEVHGVEFYGDGKFRILTSLDTPLAPADDLDRELAEFEALNGQG